MATILTDDMTRLCGEIGTLRRGRKMLRQDLAHQTKTRAATVSQMHSDLSQTRLEAARKMRAGLADFTARLRREVGGQAREVQNDLAGVRRAWCGKKVSRAAR